jgi:hypothetical protein
MIAERRPRATARRPVYTHSTLGSMVDLSDNGPAGRNLKLGREREAKLQDLHINLIYQYEAGELDVPDPPVYRSGNGARVSGYDVRASKRHKGEHSTGPGIGADTDAATFPALDAPPGYVTTLPDTEPKFMGTIRHYNAVVDRLITTGVLTENHLIMLRMVWKDGRRLERPDEDKAIGHRPLRPRRPDAKLTEAQAAEIRASRESVRALARQHNVNPRTIFAIKNGELYRAVDPEQTVAAQLQVSNAAVRRMWACATVTLWAELWP